MAKKLAAGSSSNKKDSAGRRLGFKIFPGELVTAGSIILRQRGSKWYPGQNVKMGRDFTLNAIRDGKTRSYKKFKRNFIEVLI